MECSITRECLTLDFISIELLIPKASYYEVKLKLIVIFCNEAFCVSKFYNICYPTCTFILLSTSTYFFIRNYYDYETT